MKLCSKCNQEKPEESFSKDRCRQDGLYPYCKECKSKYRKLHPESSENINKRNALPRNREKKSEYDKNRWKTYSEYRRHVKNSMLQKAYGITLKEFDDLRASQEYKCAICRAHESEVSKGLHVDHDHKTGKVRGLLCMDCNIGLGKFRDNPELLNTATSYLKKS